MKIVRFTLLVCALISSKLFAQQYAGYTLYSEQNSNLTYLIDTNSAIYHTWTHPTTDKTGYSSYLMPNRTLWRTVKTTTTLNGGGIYGMVQKVDWDGTVLWSFTYSSSTYCLHHDICPLPNGNVLLISYDVKNATESTAAGKTAGGTSWSEKIMEVKPTGATTGDIVWEWKLWDHLVQNVDATKANYQTSIAEHPELLNINYNSTQQDWVHMNGIDYNPILDQIVFSSHMLNQWFIIDHSTTTTEAATHVGGNAGKGGDFLYRYGNPTSYDMTGTTVLNVTHDAHWNLENVPNSGWLMGFNNRGVSNNQSSVDQVHTPLNGYNYAFTSGQAYSPSIYDERLACNGYSSNMGNAEKLPNGNTLVCVATAGTIYETDPNGTTLWTKTTSGAVPQAHRYSECYVDGTAIAIPTITENGSLLEASTAATYQWYLNGQPITGATNQTYTPTQTGIYLVRTTDAANCFREYSLGHYFQSSSSASIQEHTWNTVQIFPNPSDNGVFNMTIQTTKSYETCVYSISGEKILTKTNSNTLDLSKVASGIYYLVITLDSGASQTFKISKK